MVGTSRFHASCQVWVLTSAQQILDLFARQMCSGASPETDMKPQRATMCCGMVAVVLFTTVSFHSPTSRGRDL